MLVDINICKNSQDNIERYYNFMLKRKRITLNCGKLRMDNETRCCGKKQKHVNSKVLVKLNKLLGGELDKIY